MLALKINTTKAFMHKLLIGDTFHIFSLAEASITTFNQFHIDGKLHMDFLTLILHSSYLKTVTFTLPGKM